MLAVFVTRLPVRTSCQTQLVPQLVLPLIERSAVHTWQEGRWAGRVRIMLSTTPAWYPCAASSQDGRSVQQP
jgi:hypothetical protein